MTEKKDATAPERRGFLRTLGLGTAAAATTAAGTAAAQRATVVRADSVPARDARKETEAQRIAPRYRANSPHVQAFYRTNRYEH